MAEPLDFTVARDDLGAISPPKTKRGKDVEIAARLQSRATFHVERYDLLTKCNDIRLLFGRAHVNRMCIYIGKTIAAGALVKPGQTPRH